MEWLLESQRSATVADCIRGRETQKSRSQSAVYNKFYFNGSGGLNVMNVSSGNKISDHIIDIARILFIYHLVELEFPFVETNYFAMRRKKKQQMKRVRCDRVTFSLKSTESARERAKGTKKRNYSSNVCSLLMG